MNNNKMRQDYKDSETPCQAHMSWYYTGTFLAKSGEKQVQPKLFSAFILLLGEASAQLRAVTDKGNKPAEKTRLPHRFAYGMLGLTPLVGKKGLLCPKKPPQEFLERVISVIRY